MLAGEIREAVSSFSFRNIIKTNIMSAPGSTFGNNYSQASLTNLSRRNTSTNAMRDGSMLSTYYLKMQELIDYYNTDLTERVTQIYSDYITNYFSSTSDLITIDESVPGASQIAARINKVLAQVEYVPMLKKHMTPFLYNRSYSYKFGWNESKGQYEKFELANPTNVVSVYGSDRIPEEYLVTSREGTIYEVSRYSIIRFGVPKLNLINDIRPEKFDTKDDSLVVGTRMMAGQPIYYNNTPKVKEYLLKDQIVSLLSIKDLIMPLLLLLRVDANTAPDEANKLATNVENTINKYCDLSSVFSANFTIEDLIDGLLNNIRVIPDYNSGMGDMGNVDLSKIANKIQEIRSDQDGILEKILTGLAIPRSLFSGDATKWDALKSSQNLNNRINGYVQNLNDGLVETSIMIYHMLTNEWLNPSNIRPHLFNRTDSDYNSQLSNLDILSQYSDSINRVLDTTTRTLQDNKLIDPQGYANFMVEQILSAIPDLAKAVPKESVTKYVQSVLAQRSQDDNTNSNNSGW